MGKRALDYRYRADFKLAIAIPHISMRGLLSGHRRAPFIWKGEKLIYTKKKLLPWSQAKCSFERKEENSSPSPSLSLFGKPTCALKCVFNHGRRTLFIYLYFFFFWSGFIFFHWAEYTSFAIETQGGYQCTIYRQI